MVLRIFTLALALSWLGSCGDEGEEGAGAPSEASQRDGSIGDGTSNDDGEDDDANSEQSSPDPGLDASGTDEPPDAGEGPDRDAAADGQAGPEDIDSCAPGPCFAGVECTDLAPPDEGYSCGPCPDGYEGDGETCSDIPECETDNGGCDQDQICIEKIGGPPECSNIPTTKCVLTYRLEIGNGDDSSGYTDSNMRIRNTAFGAGDGTWGVGPGTLILRVPSNGGRKPAAGTAEVLYYHLPIEFITTTMGTTIDTDNHTASPSVGDEDNTDAVATGELSMGSEPEIVWDSCEFPAGYDSDENAYTPDITATGKGCLKPFRSVGNVNCSGAACGLGNLVAGDNPQDETWEQELQPLIFSSDLKSFSMPMMQMPNRTPSRTYLSWGGTRISISCTP